MVATDVAVKAADVQVGFMDRFSGALIILGGLSQVMTAVEEVVKFFVMSCISMYVRFTKADNRTG